jgi:HK97 family phage prohead protease
MKNQIEQRTLPVELRIATLENGTRTLSALIPYNSPSVDLGGFTERIAPGAFASALQSTSDVLCLRDHDSSQLMGRTKSGTLSLEDSPTGLRYTCKLPNTTQANDLIESVNRGDLDTTSFGFRTNDDSWEQRNGETIRTLLNVELHEVSPCSFAAYPATSVSLRSCPVEIRSLIEKRDDSEDDPDTMPNSNGCSCGCDECQAGDCMDCSDQDCTDDDCLKNQATRSIIEGDANRRLAIRVGFATL